MAETFDAGSMPENYAFTDGSFNIKTRAYGYGGFLVCGGERIVLKGSGNDPERAVSRNVAGEVMGAMEAVDKALERGVSELVLYYDYTGIEYWATGKWKTNKELTKEYAAFMQGAAQKMRIRFVHVKAHSGIPGNEEADRLAKEAVGLIEGASESAEPLADEKTSEAFPYTLGSRSMERIRAGKIADASVLLPLIGEKEEYSLLFEERSRLIGQGGEICFPGGHIEEGEKPAETAKRETAEELLMPASQIELVAPLFEMTGPGGRRVSSYLGKLESYQNTWRESEVERTFALPLKRLLEMKPKQYTGHYETVVDESFPFEWIPGGRDYPFKKIQRTFYFYETEYGIIWGMTAELLYHFLELCRGE